MAKMVIVRNNKRNRLFLGKYPTKSDLGKNGKFELNFGSIVDEGKKDEKGNLLMQPELKVPGDVWDAAKKRPAIQGLLNERTLVEYGSA